MREQLRPRGGPSELCIVGFDRELFRFLVGTTLYQAGTTIHEDVGAKKNRSILCTSGALDPLLTYSASVPDFAHLSVAKRAHFSLRVRKRQTDGTHLVRSQQSQTDQMYRTPAMRLGSALPGWAPGGVVLVPTATNRGGRPLLPYVHGEAS